MDGLDQFVEALEKLPLRRRQGLLARCVSRAALEGTSPPDFLYASIRAGRYNPTTWKASTGRKVTPSRNSSTDGTIKDLRRTKLSSVVII